ncbi:hypothetical protein G3480_23345 [Thiorhodococcus mannitoliphagus]|uniref:Uncharacterized protein n=1 Tax=Thiorhodococcus mannitoliphagus TaxID=329406 RepID=A0A6P1DY01_9GAMM|nr:hypothetical protein [Thiorhodococcus mannitoliphagus]NEX23197.1 hypothetical protein [Thiorhodococcus mannitoliphagus]
MSVLAQALTILCALGAATAAGVFFTFSTFTMAGLKRLSAAQGMAAMQASGVGGGQGTSCSAAPSCMAPAKVV